MTLEPQAIYVLPIPQFFSHSGGVGGHIAHAYGVIQGLTQAGYSLNIVAEEGCHISFKEQMHKWHLFPIDTRSLWRRQLWSRHLIREVKRLKVACSQQFCYTRYSVGFAPWVPHLKKVLGEVPLILEVNSFATQRYSWMRVLECRAMDTSDLLISISHTNRQHLIEKLHQRLKKKILVLPNGVDVDRFSPTLSHDYLSENRIVRLGYTGILKQDYGLEVLLDAFGMVRKTHKDVTLHIYGDGPFRHVLAERAKAFEGIVFHGPISFFDVPNALQEIDIAINTASPAIEQGSPIKLYEYMAARKPIIHARTQQVEAVLAHEERGLMYNASDARELAEKIRKLIDHPDLAQKIATNAWQEASKNHSWGNRVERLLDDLRRRRLINGR